jgi:hypothetical protein
MQDKINIKHVMQKMIMRYKGRFRTGAVFFTLIVVEKPRKKLRKITDIN